jgi:hypothetical protein
MTKGMIDQKRVLMKAFMKALASPHAQPEECSPPTQLFLSDMADAALAARPEPQEVSEAEVGNIIINELLEPCEEDTRRIMAAFREAGYRIVKGGA